MKVLIDTSIWSLALRRTGAIPKEDRLMVSELRELIHEVRAVLIGPIRQELLSGIQSKAQFNALKKHLEVFEDFPITRQDYERAAEFHTTCRQSGIQGSHIDFLICSMAKGAGMPIFTADKDFLLYGKHLPITLYQPRRN
jgi:predicted nucleic acid-binding protein